MTSDSTSLRRPASRPTREPLLQKNALVSGRIVEFAEYLIPELWIEARGLETERVDPGRMTAALERTGLGVAHELAPDPLAPQRVADPEVADEEAAGIGFAREPRADALPIAGEHGTR